VTVNSLHTYPKPHRRRRELFLLSIMATGFHVASIVKEIKLSLNSAANVEREGILSGHSIDTFHFHWQADWC
jgi:hypothetical protein